MESDSNHWLMSASLVTSSIVAVTANSFLLLIFCRKRSLRTVPNRFIINLLVTNLLSSLLLIPLLIADQQGSVTHHNTTDINPQHNGTVEIEAKVVIREEIFTSNTTNFEFFETTTLLKNISSTNSSLDEILCYLARGSTTFVCTLSILSILLIGINQYFGVIHSLRYHFYINKFRSSMFILTTWLVALTFSIMSCLTRSDGTLWRFCHRIIRSSSQIVRIFNTIYAFTYFTVVILAPFVAICMIYVCIYKAARKNSQRMRSTLDYHVPATRPPSPVVEQRAKLPKVQSAPNFQHYTGDIQVKVTPTKVQRHISDRQPNFIANLKHKISNVSMFKYREETRAAKISVLVIFLVLFCYVPYGLTVIFSSDLIQIDTCKHFNYLSLVLLVFSNIISPFLFAYRNKRVKREIGRMFGLVLECDPNKLAVLDERHRRPSSALPSDDHNIREPFLTVPIVVVTCKLENERKSILKRVCDSSTWSNCKKCNIIAVPDSCINTEARGSFSSASTQISNDD